jgi:hypothetical protein
VKRHAPELRQVEEQAADALLFVRRNGRTPMVSDLHRILEVGGDAWLEEVSR